MRRRLCDSNLRFFRAFQRVNQGFYISSIKTTNLQVLNMLPKILRARQIWKRKHAQHFSRRVLAVEIAHQNLDYVVFWVVDHGLQIFWVPRYTGNKFKCLLLKPKQATCVRSLLSLQTFRILHILSKKWYAISLSWVSISSESEEIIVKA